MKVSLFTIFLCLSLYGSTQQYLTQERKEIVGTWLHEDGEWKLVFQSTGIALEYQDGQLVDKYVYSISDKPPDSEDEVFEDNSEQVSFLYLSSTADTSDKQSFEINGVGQQILSLRPLGHSRTVIFHKLDSRRKKIANAFRGEWLYEADAGVFSIKINQQGNKLTGTYCSVMANGSRIDCADSGKNSITGVIVNAKTALITFKSSYGNGTGKATLTLDNSTHLEWRMTIEPKGEFWIPQIALLRKK